MNMKIIEMDISEVIPYANNPRDNSKAIDAVAASIREFGFKVPVVIDRNNILITGHTRLEAAGNLGSPVRPDGSPLCQNRKMRVPADNAAAKHDNITAIVPGSLPG